MQIAVASNLYGNFPALESLLWEIEKLRDRGRFISKVYVIGVLGALPYAREIFEVVSKLDEVIPVRGKLDDLIIKSDEKLETKLPRSIEEALRWNWDNLGVEGRKWLKNQVKPFISEKFGDYEFYFTYGNPAEPKNEVKPKMPLSYYEKIHELFKNYKVIVVAGKEEFCIKTPYGKIVSPGPLGVKLKKNKRPVFAVIDTETTNVHFFEIEYDEFEIKDRLEMLNFPKDIKKSIQKIFLQGKILSLKF